MNDGDGTDHEEEIQMAQRIDGLRRMPLGTPGQRIAIERAAERTGLIREVQRLIDACTDGDQLRLDARTVVEDRTGSYILEEDALRCEQRGGRRPDLIVVVLSGYERKRGQNRHLALDADVACANATGAERIRPLVRASAGISRRELAEVAAEAFGDSPKERARATTAADETLAVHAG